ncbi:kinase-like domain-containing protein [Rostrohypoxylon terebratum]|nr:kinase-like domain-containing protein [Rostrohypoxylon terebratum]
MASPGHIRDSVKQIDETSWLIGGKHIVRYFQRPYKCECLLKNSRDGSCYTLSDATPTLPAAEPIPSDSYVHQIHDAGDSSAVFSFGETLILKVKSTSEGGLQEHDTLVSLAQKQLSFNIPTVLFCFQEAKRTYLFEPYMTGKSLNEVWWDMDTDGKEHLSTRIASICSELAAFPPSDIMISVDYNWMDPLREPEQRDCSPAALKTHCTNLGMDCSNYVFSHNDLGPTNILIHGDQITIIDWDLAGYYPLAWVRTKFAICGALDMERVSNNVEWKLGDMGFPEVTGAYNELWKTRLEEWKKRRLWL